MAAADSTLRSPAYRGKVHKLLADPETHGLTLLILCLEMYPDYFDVDFLEILARLHDDFGTHLSQSGENRLQAITVVMVTDEFENEPGVFDSVCKTLYTGDPDVQYNAWEDETDTMALQELLWGQYEAEVALDRKMDYSDTVRAYIDVVYTNTWNHSEEEYEDIASDLHGEREKLSEELLSLGFGVSGLPEI